MEKRFKDRLANLSTLGNGIVPGVPLIEIIADRRVLIEHHNGICRYTREQICVRTSYGAIKIEGSGLYMKKMTKEQLLITGQIACICICRGRSQ